jgi:uncharacterized protein YutE (UPF0331/DUF86 family)
MNLTQIYNEAVTGKPPATELTQEQKIEIEKARLAELQSWEDWCREPMTARFAQMLVQARSDISVAIGDTSIMIPNVDDKFLRTKLNEIGTLQKVLRAMKEGKYSKD